MRVGKWVPIYKQMLPIPRRLAMAFGLYEKSELHIARIKGEEKSHRMGAELIVSPIPTSSWRSACRLSVRLSDQPHSLATAANFLREKRINILLGECCNTYRHRAHWDAICDVSAAAGYDALASEGREKYETRLTEYLDGLTKEYRKYMNRAENRQSFNVGAPKYVQFAPLTGLNDASFITRMNNDPVSYQAGRIEIPDALTREIISQCNINDNKLPRYAMITGNTEQRYMRVLFLRDPGSLFRIKIDDDLSGFAEGGVGVLAQLLNVLPEEINLIKTSNYIKSKNDQVARGRITLMGHWNLTEPAPVDDDQKKEMMRSELTRILESAPLVDVEGKTHTGKLRVVEFAVPKTVYPRVYISYSTRRGDDKLEYLRATLLQNQFYPVLGTDVAESTIGTRATTADVTQSSFQPIDECVAFISLQVRRDDFLVRGSNGRPDRYVMPPWAVAEEVYAWSSSTGGLVVRLKENGVEDPQYNRNVREFTFVPDNHDSFESAVDDVMSELHKFRYAVQYTRVTEDARQAQYRESYSPPDE